MKQIQKQYRYESVCFLFHSVEYCGTSAVVFWVIRCCSTDNTTAYGKERYKINTSWAFTNELNGLNHELVSNMIIKKNVYGKHQIRIYFEFFIFNPLNINVSCGVNYNRLIWFVELSCWWCQNTQHILT